MVITGANDDSLDWTDGWDGRVQHLYIAQDDTVECDEGNESDNNGDGNDNDPHSDPKIWNMTLVGAPLCEGRGLLLKEGTRARYFNSIITQAPGPGVQVSDTTTCAEMNSGGMTFKGLTIWNNNGSTEYADQFAGDCDVASFMMTQPNIITDMDPLLIRPEAGPQPKPFPQAESHVGMIGYSARPPDDNWCDTTAQYHGAFSPHPMASESKLDQGVGERSFVPTTSNSIASSVNGAWFISSPRHGPFIVLTRSRREESGRAGCLKAFCPAFCFEHPSFRLVRDRCITLLIARSRLRC